MTINIFLRLQNLGISQSYKAKETAFSSSSLSNNLSNQGGNQREDFVFTDCTNQNHFSKAANWQVYCLPRQS